MRRVPKPQRWPLAFSGFFFVIATAESCIAAMFPEETYLIVMVAALCMAWWSGKAWALYWKWRTAYKKYEEWSKQ